MFASLFRSAPAPAQGKPRRQAPPAAKIRQQPQGQRQQARQQQESPPQQKQAHKLSSKQRRKRRLGEEAQSKQLSQAQDATKAAAGQPTTTEAFSASGRLLRQAKGEDVEERLQVQQQQRQPEQRRGTKRAAEPSLPEGASEQLSKRQRKRLRAARAAEAASKSSGVAAVGAAAGAKAGARRAGSSAAAPPQPLLLSVASGSCNCVGKAAARLKGSRFRWLNETLYSTTGAEARALFEDDPTLATAYHEGYTAQRAKWPRDPLDDVVAWIRKKVPKTAVIGDFGCGEARLAEQLSDRQVHSFDLVRINERVTPCNLADVPLPDGSLDVVVFCLALMGTDWPAFVAEAHRCLRPGGLCHIVEVESRFEDVGAVVAQIQGIGFRQVLKRPGNFFVEFRFQRDDSAGDGGAGGAARGRGSVARRGARRRRGSAEGRAGAEGAGLKACTYLRR